MKQLCYGILLCLGSGMFSGVFAQGGSPRLITGDFQNIPAGEFLQELANQSGTHIYYDSAKLDSLHITLTAVNEPLDSVLKKAFARTPYYFSADLLQDIFITRGRPVVTSLPAGFFEGKLIPAEQPGEITDFLNDTTKPVISTLENKLYVIGAKNSTASPGRISVAGYIRDIETGEPVIGASVYIEKPHIGVVTDQYGYFSISLPAGRHILYVQSIGMRDTKRQLLVYSDGKLNIDMQSQVMTLKRVVVSAEKASNIRNLQMGLQRIDIKTIKQVPVVFGEPDVLRVMLTLPGVKSVGEASTGLNVRGGSSDQNLILFNDATIFNPSHFFGLFSAFNPEVVSDAELYKSSIPARYGGRLSSVLDVESREGNKKNITGSAGIGPLTSRVNLEGPLVKDQSSFIIGARTTYADWLLNLLPQQYKNSKAGFYDMNLDINYEIDRKNFLYVTGYLSRDNFSLNQDTTYRYGNSNFSLKWKHLFNNKIYSLVTAGYDGYQYHIASDSNPVNAYTLSYNIHQFYFKTHVNYFVNAKHTLEFGLSSILYKLHPGSLEPDGSRSQVTPDVVSAEQALENAVYFSDKYNVSQAFTVEGGIRYSLFSYLGPHSVNYYAPGLPKTTDNQVGTTFFPGGHFIKTYGGPELRLSARYALNENLSLKAGYNSQRQYIHLLSNTASMSPTDIWKLSDPNIRPQFGDQFSIGLYRNFKSNTIETSIELYYKDIRDYLDYKSGAQLVLNHHIETDLINTRGKAYGIELLIKKLTGKLNGWISYTYSRTLLKMDDPTAGELINKGDFYPANYDEPNDATVIANYRFSHRFSISLNTTYNTGRPITLPIAVYSYQGSYRTLYSDRNAYRIPDYFRMDFSMNIEGNHKVHQKTHNSWTIGVYNLTGRKNPYSVYYVSQNGVVNGYKLSIFGSAIPFINFNIRF